MTDIRRYDFAVIGAGIVGLAVARRIQEHYPGRSVVVLEQADRVAAHQSGHSSGVIHAGVYYAPGSAKAVLCRAGLEATVAFCEAHGITYRQCGKLVVATDALEHERLERLAERAEANGVDCVLVDRARLASLEPHIAGRAALHVRESGIVDYRAIAACLASLVREAGGDVVLGARVCAIDEDARGVSLDVATDRIVAGHVVACAGLQADRIAAMAGLPLDFAIVPFRGDFFRLRRPARDIASHLIYPVPDPALPFLGVHLTATIDGGMTIGPSAMLAFSRERYSRFAVSPKDTVAMLRFPGLWRLLRRHVRAGIAECRHALSRRAYLAAAQKYCPKLQLDDLGAHDCGIRAQAVSRDGALIHDFEIRTTPRAVHVCNAPSPAATAALPIAERIVDEALAERVG